MSKEKQKGTWLESLVVKSLVSLGIADAHRIALHGSRDKGDVFAGWVDGRPFIIECKNTVRTSITGWLNELRVEMINSGAEFGAVVFKLPGIGEKRPELLPAVMPLGVLGSLIAYVRGLEARLARYEAKHGPLD